MTRARRFARACRAFRYTLAVAGVIICGGSTISFASASPTMPGLPRLAPATPQVRDGDPLLPFYSDSGKISLSVDAIGTNDPAGAPIKVHKNAGATVSKAFLFAASTGFSGYTPVDGDVTLNGTPVTWDPANTIANDISSVNVEADVTSIVKPIVDAAPAGDVSITAAEPNETLNMDGEILAVILDDPTVADSNSVALLYGAQATSGDTFHVALAQPVDKTNPNFGLDLSLGISYGYQPAGQFSTVSVNGNLMTSSAGGQDDCVEKYAAVPDLQSNCGNGELITAGGIGDSTDNPPDPTATDSTCTAPAPAPRCDDELYSLLPFVSNGDASLTFTTQNPSNDDNIFFGALTVNAGAAVVGEGIVLGPVSATNNVGQPHTVTATVQDAAGAPVSATTVTFTVTAGPNAGTTGTAVTDANGHASFTYTSSTGGTDTIVASFVDGQKVTRTSNEVTKTWVASTQPAPTTLSVTAATGDFADATSVSAVLKDTALLTPIPGESVTLKLNGTETCTATTDVTGTATCQITPTEAAGAYPLVATFAGDGAHAASSSSGTFTVTHEETALNYTGDTSAVNGSSMTLSGILTTDDPSAGTPLSGKTVAFTLGSGGSAQTCSGTTDASGAASCTISSVSQAVGSVAISASFAGDGFYLPASATSSASVFPPTGLGAFVIGDRSAGSPTTGRTVYFWGSQWANRNSFSGGAAPSAMKGFADSPIPSLTCGSTFTSRPGSSSTPPSSLPAQIDVIVSSHVTKTGSIVSGDIEHIVVVQLNPGYGPAPGHVGTGTIVGVIC